MNKAEKSYIMFTMKNDSTCSLDFYILMHIQISTNELSNSTELFNDVSQCEICHKGTIKHILYMLALLYTMNFILVIIQKQYGKPDKIIILRALHLLIIHPEQDLMLLFSLFALYPLLYILQLFYLNSNTCSSLLNDLIFLLNIQHHMLAIILNHRAELAIDGSKFTFFSQDWPNFNPLAIPD